jgi:hypothetical protein
LLLCYHRPWPIPRNTAERLRKKADRTAHVETRETILTIAALYEWLAETLAKRRQEPKNS